MANVKSTLHVEISPEIEQALQNICRAEGKSRREVVEEALRDHLRTDESRRNYDLPRGY